MIIIPAVDIKGGRCVRLEQGMMARETTFSNHPEEMALGWEKKGAQRLHLVDLDGAVQGKTSNKTAIKRVVDTVSIPVQLGGGIRSLDSIEEYINLGVAKIIIGTGAYKNPELIEMACRYYPGRIIVAIDSRDGYACIEGWTEATSTVVIDLAKRFEALGITAIVYTDIGRDGMKTGPNADAIRRFAKNINIPVIAAGGIASIKDIEDLMPLEDDGVEGIIVGRALYDRSITLEEAIDRVRRRDR
ncbi:MAG: 1-(5-phosphoribosyl)-5-[(5-phosphoribosylamino)methylideneamino]imidazole-4-carboxamide isomerase [Deltaproteobacteria bacterium]|nr:1-(5-phosphoribosyl)-5-[(5-phosphoribosylamino)methylideneamino]imidazole-4-carboxamide isomerase [Deltaproteobacteria bacterium]MBW2341308.1 1-(5-phosphoribosyl)-5-[(5-phosphoribosylamino)methylideneamino]imidazole-4-carboxamide isomerase [Deltaproteobacteria bacterium]